MEEPTSSLCLVAQGGCAMAWVDDTVEVSWILMSGAVQRSSLAGQ